MILREANENDIKRIAELEKICFPTEPWSENMIKADIVDNDQATYYVCDMSDEGVPKEQAVVGYVGVWQILDEGHITNVAIAPEYRRRHIAESLILVMMTQTLKKGVKSWTLEVRASNEAAINLYTKRGFLAEGIRRGYYQDNNEDAIIMWWRAGTK